MIKVTRLQKMLAVLAVCCIAMGLLLLAGSPPGVYAEGSAEPNYSITHSMRVGRQEGAAANGTFEGYLHTLWSDADGDVTEAGTGSHVYFAEGGENFYVRSIDCGAYMVYNFDVSSNVSAAEMKFYIGKTWKVSFAVGPRTVWDGKAWQKGAGSFGCGTLFLSVRIPVPAQRKETKSFRSSSFRAAALARDSFSFVSPSRR